MLQISNTGEWYWQIKFHSRSTYEWIKFGEGLLNFIAEYFVFRSIVWKREN